jgi:hypothetical protein
MLCFGTWLHVGHWEEELLPAVLLLGRFLSGTPPGTAFSQARDRKIVKVQNYLIDRSSYGCLRERCCSHL